MIFHLKLMMIILMKKLTSKYQVVVKLLKINNDLFEFLRLNKRRKLSKR